LTLRGPMIQPFHSLVSSSRLKTTRPRRSNLQPTFFHTLMRIFLANITVPMVLLDYPVLV
jgi:hypothetical protein